MGSVMDDQERPWEASARRARLMRDLRLVKKNGDAHPQFGVMMNEDDAWDLLCAMEVHFKAHERGDEGRFEPKPVACKPEDITAQCQHGTEAACSHCHPEWDPGGP